MSDSIVFDAPVVSGAYRRSLHKEVRDNARDAEHSGFDDPVETRPNTDETDYSEESYVGNFSKGLLHDDEGLLVKGYPGFVHQINQTDAGSFEDLRPAGCELTYTRKVKGKKEFPDWRGWESPRTGHYYDLEGTDANGIGMARAPALGERELAFEMAEVYGMALLRDVAFCNFNSSGAGDSKTGITVEQVVRGINRVWQQLAPTYSAFTERRYSARLGEPGVDYDVATGVFKSGRPSFTANNLFRGSGPGSKAGPWVSQFMLVGDSEADKVGKDNTSVHKEACETNSDEVEQRGFISYGSQVIDQRCKVFEPHLDYMLNWEAWLDVQNGIDVRGQHKLAPERRFLATPRDMATYVRFDALYQAYLNACLLLLKIEAKTQDGFPEQGSRARTPFASFGGHMYCRW